MSEVIFYGADWCSDCRRSKALLNAEGVEFELRDVEHNDAYTAESQAISGRTNIPVIKFADGEFLVEPSDALLREELKKRNLI
jgi:mycoredoxin